MILKNVLLFASIASAIVSCDKKQSENLLTLTEDDTLTTTPSGVVEFNSVWYNEGDTIWGFKDYVYLVVGSAGSPLILGVPHDGVGEGSPVIPEVTTTGRDIYSHPFANLIATYFEQDTDKKPWIMVNTIGRKRVDPNTYPSSVASTYSNADAIATYNSYHELLSLARATVAAEQAGGNGALFLDVHGHAHGYTGSVTQTYRSVVNGNTLSSNFIHQTDVGYALSNWALEQSDSYVDGLKDSSSVYYIGNKYSSIPFSRIIRGDSSFGGLLVKEGVPAVPGTTIPVLDRSTALFGGTTANPGRRPYFNGGYCTRNYGTVQLGSTTGFNDNVVSIQIETPGINVRNNGNTRERSSHQFKRAIINYLNIWMGYSYPNSAYPYTKYW